jgi:hypothetical protein
LISDRSKKKPRKAEQRKVKKRRKEGRRKDSDNATIPLLRPHLSC